MSEVIVEGVEKTFSRKETVAAVAGVDFQVEPGELLVLLGPSGCGKTTLLRCIGGLEKVNAGRISLHGTVVSDAAQRVHQPPNKRDIGFVFQNFVLWPHMTVRANIAYPLKARRRTHEMESRIDEVLEIVQCGHLAQRYPTELSGGQQQRVALARALAARPAVLLLDEPLSNLDALLRIELRTQLREIHQAVGYTGIYVTHDQGEALNLGTRVAVMRSGLIEQLGTPDEIYSRPATEHVATFMGVRNSLNAKLEGGRLATDAGPLRGHMASLSGLSGDSHRVLIRPEKVVLCGKDQSRDGLAFLEGGVVADVLFGGEQIDYVIKIGDSELYARAHGEQPRHRPGDAVDVAFDPSNGLLYTDTVFVRTLS